MPLFHHLSKERPQKTYYKQGGNVALAMSQFFGSKVAAVCVQVGKIQSYEFSTKIIFSVLHELLFHYLWKSGGFLLWSLSWCDEIQRPGDKTKSKNFLYIMVVLVQYRGKVDKTGLPKMTTIYLFGGVFFCE